METRLCNIFKTANVTELVILESPYKVSQNSWNGAIFEEPVQFWSAVWFWASASV